MLFSINPLLLPAPLRIAPKRPLECVERSHAAWLNILEAKTFHIIKPLLRLALSSLTQLQ